jgi:hypothetical protein
MCGAPAVFLPKNDANDALVFAADSVEYTIFDVALDGVARSPQRR